jgi:hypothetical protein
MIFKDVPCIVLLTNELLNELLRLRSGCCGEG